MKEIRDIIKYDTSIDLSRYDEITSVLDFGVSFAISGMLAIVFKTVLAPLERIKLILQTQASSQQIGTENRSPYTGFFNAITRVPREQGFLSLWRGNILNICRYFPTQAINFSVYDIYYEAFEKIIQPKTERDKNLIPFLSGGAVGVTTYVLLFPISLCNTRISVDVGDGKVVKREFVSLRDCVTKVYKNDGLKGFYQGMSHLTVGVFIYRSSYFGIYTMTKRMYMKSVYESDPNRLVQTPLIVSLALAQLSSFTGSFIAYPLDTIGRQKMLWSGRGAHNYVSTRQVVKKIIQKDGPIGFYRGYFASVLTTICGSCVLVSYDIIKGYYDRFMKPKAASDTRRPLRKVDDR